MKQRDFLLVVGFTFITVLCWIIFTVYHAHVTSTISPALKENIEPIAPRFDTTTVEELKKQRKTIGILPEAIGPTLSSPASPSPTLKFETKPASPGGLQL